MQKIKIMKLVKKGTSLLVLSLFLLVSAIIILSSGYYVYKEKSHLPLKFNEVNKEGTYAFVDVSLMTDYFAEEDKTDAKMYMIFDSDYVYIAKMNDNGRKNLNMIYEFSHDEDITNAPAPIPIYGMSELIPEDLKDLALESYNEMYPDKKITKEEFSNLFGDYYLDTISNPFNSGLLINIIISLILVVIGVIFLYGYFVYKKQHEGNFALYKEKLKDIDYELNSKDTIIYNKEETYLTPNYFINNSYGLEIIPYKDIVWLYIKEFKIKGIMSKTLYIVSQDGKVYTGLSLADNQKNTFLIQQIFESLVIKCPKALAGYTEENIARVKRMYNRSE